MTPLINYIQERIRELENKIQDGALVNNLNCYARMYELEAVLSKIEELGTK